MIAICLSERWTFILKWSQAWQCLCDLSSWLKLVSTSVCPWAQRGRCVCTFCRCGSLAGTASLTSSFILIFFLLSLPSSWRFPLSWSAKSHKDISRVTTKKGQVYGYLCSVNMSRCCRWSCWGGSRMYKRRSQAEDVVFCLYANPIKWRLLQFRSLNRMVL